MDLKLRSEIDKKYLWDLSAVYPSDDAWEKDLKKVQESIPELLVYKGELNEPAALLEFLKKYEAVSEVEENLYVYAFMRFFEDTSNAKYDEMKGRISLLAAEVAAQTVFVKKELSSLSESQLESMLSETPELEKYRYFLQSYARFHPHILSEETETALAELSVVIDKSDDIFSAFNDTDIEFPSFTHNGKEYQLSHGQYSKIMESPDRELRKTAYEYYYKPFRQNRNVLGNSYAAAVLANVKISKIKKYDSALDAALFQDELPRSVFEQLVETAASGVHAVERFNELKKKELGIDDLAFYDNYTSVVTLPREDFSYEEVVEIVEKSLAPLGESYLKKYKEALEARVIDVFETKYKRSGAFSWGSYHSRGYMFLNYKGTFRDVSTFTHELGHCLHRDFSAEHQPFIYYGNPIFLAEIASTFNECLLYDYLIKNATDDNERKFYRYHFLKLIESTFFRQTMFGEYENLTHKAAEAGEVLTADKLTELYGGVLERFLGKNMAIDDNLRHEWTRIPHFYRPFYVFKYATSVSAAIALSERVLAGDTVARDAYLEFLGAGSHKPPLEVLLDAGIDLRKPDAYRDTVKKMESLLDEY